jgi:predicted Fe-Mo cluster-binding NifX family protein
VAKIIYAIPAVGGKLSPHFGHSENFVVVETENNVITKEYSLTPPEHVPGAYPQFLASHGVNFVIAGGMGQRAVDIFTQNGITVIMGANSVEPKVLVQDHINGQLESGDNSCDSDHHGNEGNHEHHHN